MKSPRSSPNSYRDIDSVIAFDAFAFEEEERRPCPQLSPIEPLTTSIPERPRAPRCEAAERELLRQQFPNE